VKIKICGIKDSETLNCCSENNVDYFGLLFYEKSPRNINLKKASELISKNKKVNISPVGVFVNHEINELNGIIKKLNLKIIQLHGNENDEYIVKLKETKNLKVIKSIGIKDSKDLSKIKKYQNADYFLFDYKPNENELPGGNSKAFDWSILKNLKIDKPWFISGGINIKNINVLLKKLNPYGIDISSGVESSPGNKSINKINSIFQFYDSK